ncbi:MAG TPA: hypothetical protein VKU19_24335 [Bryobacteraceae bacterium]|nr:hypothetical protein [Bryobacteraceae bacterium]
MSDLQFEKWIQRLARVDTSIDPPGAHAIWWRAQLRRRFEAGERAMRPLRITQATVLLACWVPVAVMAARFGAGALTGFLGITAVAIGGLETIVQRRF